MKNRHPSQITLSNKDGMSFVVDVDAAVQMIDDVNVYGINLQAMRNVASWVKGMASLTGDDFGPVSEFGFKTFIRDCVMLNPMALVSINGGSGEQGGRIGYDAIATRSALQSCSFDSDCLDVIKGLRAAICGDDISERSRALAHCASNAEEVRSLLDTMTRHPLRTMNPDRAVISSDLNYDGEVAFDAGVPESEVYPLSDGSWPVSTAGYLYGAMRDDFQVTMPMIRDLIRYTIESPPKRYALCANDMAWNTICDQEGNFNIDGLIHNLSPTVDAILSQIDMKKPLGDRIKELDDLMATWDGEMSGVIDDWNASVRAAPPTQMKADFGSILLHNFHPAITPDALMKEMRQRVQIHLDTMSDICRSADIDPSTIPFMSMATHRLQSLVFGASQPDVRILLVDDMALSNALAKQGVTFVSTLPDLVLEMMRSNESKKPIAFSTPSEEKNRLSISFLLKYMPEQTRILLPEAFKDIPHSDLLPVHDVPDTRDLIIITSPSKIPDLVHDEEIRPRLTLDAPPPRLTVVPSCPAPDGPSM